MYVRIVAVRVRSRAPSAACPAGRGVGKRPARPDIAEKELSNEPDRSGQARAPLAAVPRGTIGASADGVSPAWPCSC